MKTQYKFKWKEYQSLHYSDVGSGMVMIVQKVPCIKKDLPDYLYASYIGFFHTKGAKGGYLDTRKMLCIGRYPTIEGAKKCCEAEITKKIKSASRCLDEIKDKV